jgi:hypothetical protein
VFRVDASPIIVRVEPAQTTMSNPLDHLLAEVYRQLSIVNVAPFTQHLLRAGEITGVQ